MSAERQRHQHTPQRISRHSDIVVQAEPHGFAGLSMMPLRSVLSERATCCTIYRRPDESKAVAQFPLDDLIRKRQARARSDARSRLCKDDSVKPKQQQTPHTTECWLAKVSPLSRYTQAGYSVWSPSVSESSSGSPYSRVSEHEAERLLGDLHISERAHLWRALWPGAPCCE